jgi:hypothetical protein
MGPLLPFLLWIICFTDMPRQVMGRTPNRPRTRSLS